MIGQNLIGQTPHGIPYTGRAYDKPLQA